jgi:allantoinase
MNAARPRVDYSPIGARPTLRWPNDARVAFWVSPNVEHYEYLPAHDGMRDPWPRTPYPDVQQYAYRDYGNRVGFWRMTEVLDAHKIRCCVSLNIAVLEHFPEIAQAMIDRDYDFMSHGFYNTRYLNAYTEAEERAFYQDSIDSLKRLTGKTLRGMLGPSLSGTIRTPDLMAEAGLIYYTDLVHDDQPVPLNVASGKLVSVPYSIELNDVPVFRNSFEGEYFVELCKAQFDRLYAEGAHSGRVMCLALHPYIIGQPHRARYLDEILSYVRSHDAVWHTTADEIAQFYIANYYEQMVAHSSNVTAVG